MAEMRPSGSAGLRHILILTVASFLLYFWNLGAIPFYDRGEPREGLVVAEMVSSGNLILPQVNGEYIPYKPPLFHWLGVIAVKLFGRVDEFTLRLPSALLGMLGILLTYWIGARVWGSRAGFVAGVILLTNVQWWIAATNVQVDMALTFFLIAAAFAFLLLYRDPRVRPWQSAGLAILLACATLAKGPLGIVLPSMAFAIFLVLRRDFAFLKKLNLWCSGGLFLLVAGSWYGLAMWQGGAAFILRQIIDENFRTATGEYGHPQALYYFLPVLFSNLSIWGLFLIPMGISRWRREPMWQGNEVTFLSVWFAVVFVLFSLSSGKRAIYILPLYPAFALVFGAWWSVVERSAKIDRVTLALSYGIALIGLLGVALFFAWSMAGDVSRFFPKSRNFLFVSGILVQNYSVLRIAVIFSSAALLTALWALYRRSLGQVFAAFAALALVAVLIVKGVFYPTVAKELSLKPFAQKVAQLVDAEAPLMFYRAFDFGVILYLHRHIHSYQEIAPVTRTPFFLLMWEETWPKLIDAKGLQVLVISEGIGPARRHRMLLVKASENFLP